MSSNQAQEIGAHGESSIIDAPRFLTFALNGDAYALNIFHVTEIIEYRHLTVVPMMPDFIRGVINLRGRAVPVIDLAVRFARGSTSIARRTSIIIVHINESSGAPGEPGTGPDGAGSGAAARTPGPARAAGAGQDIGILVDAVNKVVAIAPDDMEPPPAFGAGIRADYISGMAKRDNDFVIVLDIDRVLSLDDLVDLGRVGVGTRADGADGADGHPAAVAA